MILGFIGKKRVGKDTSADILTNICDTHYNIKFKRYALADPIKEIGRIMFNFTDYQLFGAGKDQIDLAWNIKPRDFFEQFGTEIMQFDIYKYLPKLEPIIPKREFWVRSLFDKIDKTRIPGTVYDNVLITDVRGNHEAKLIVARGGILIHISKPDVDVHLHEDIQQHITQIEPDQILNEYITYTVINDGSLEQLEVKIQNIINLLPMKLK